MGRVIGRVVSPVFVGRTAELETLASAYRQAVNEGPTVALVAGEAGIGKSRLVAEFARGLGDDPRLLVGGCVELGADGLPYAPFVTIVRSLVRELGPEHVKRLLSGRVSLARWLPELGEDDGGAVDHDHEQGRARLFGEVLTLIEREAADRPIVSVVEDLHWADSSSRDLLVFLARNLTQSRVLLVGTYRVEAEGSQALRPLLAELGRAPRIHLVEPAPLSRHDVGRQLAAILGREPEPVLVARVHERSDGNPLFVEALVDAGESTPATLRDLLLAGLPEMSDRGRRVLRAAAVAGSEFSHALLEAITGLDELDLEQAVRQIVDRQYLVPAESGYVFRHALIRAAVYDDLLPGERARLHTRCADALLADPSLVPEGRAPAELAAHWFVAGDQERALDAAWRAAVVAGRSFAYDEQVLMLERVLALWDRVNDPGGRLGLEHAEVLGTAARACLSSGDAERGVEWATAALDEINAETAPELAARVLNTRSWLMSRINVGGHADLERALRLLPADKTVDRGNLLVGLAGQYLSVADHERARAPSFEALEIARATGDPDLLAFALTDVAFVTSLAGDAERGMARFREARDAATHAGNDYALLTAMLWEASVHHISGEIEKIAEVTREGLDLSRKVGLLRTRGTVLAANLAGALFDLGRWEEADVVIEESLAASPPPLYLAFLEYVRGDLALARGDLAAAASAVATVDRVGRGGGEVERGLLYRYHLMCRLAVAEGDSERADQLLEEALVNGNLLVYPICTWFLLTAGAEVQRARLARAYRDAVARAAIAGRLAHLRALSANVPATQPAEQAWRAWFYAEVDDDQPTWDRAVAAWRALRVPYWMARCLARAAEAALTAGDRRGAEGRLSEAATIAADLGAVPLSREIEQLATRGRLSLRGPEAVPLRGPDPGEQLGLTPREVDVLRLVAEGRSNRQIGEELFISSNTAGVHVSNILSKLGVASRIEAAAVAHRSDLLDASDN